MTKKPTYEELERKVKELEKETVMSKRAEEELRESEEKYRHLVESLLDVVYEFDLEGRFIYVNEAVTHMFGYSKDEILSGMMVKDIIVEEDQVASRKVIDEVLKGKTIVGERTFIRKDGTKFIGEIHSGPIYMGKDVLGVRGILRDITERKQAEKELRIKDSAIESSINAIAMADLEGNLIHVNNSFLKMWGYDDENEVLGKPAVKFWQETEEATMIIESLRERGGWVGELIAMKKDKSLFDAQLSATMVTHQAGNPICMMGSFVDISERKQAEQDLRESEEKYRNLFENANDAIFIAETKTNIILDANKQAEQLTGRPRQEIIGMHQSRLHPPYQTEYYEDKFREYVNKGKIFDLEAEVIKKDGSIVPVFISASVISLHGREVMQGLFRDITEEKEILELKEEIATRKLVEKAKGILMGRHNISEEDAMKRLQKESRSQRKKIKEIAQGVISSKSILK